MKTDSQCDRCGGVDHIWTMSLFNTDWICQDCCDAEVKHPKYDEAKAVENEAVRQGNYNFAGIGLPEDLKKTKREIT